MVTKEFRLFDPDKKKFIEEFYICPDGSILINEGVMCYCLEPLDNGILDMWTGEYDDYNVKIWESDIIEVDHHYNGKRGFRDVVVMHDDSVCFVFDDILRLNGCDKIKVIGNCHLNADLLIDCEWLDRRKDENNSKS